MNKIIHPCDVPEWDGKKYPLFCRIEIEDGNLSISGVIGPRMNGNCKGGCGQVDMEFDHTNKSQNDPRYEHPIKAVDLQFADGWNTEIWYQFLDVWHTWHLNNMKSACEHQEALGWTYEDHRGENCPVCGYEIGSAWLKRALPQNVIDFLASLPDTDKQPAWV